MERLIHIIPTCPSIAQQALQLAVKQSQNLRDPSLYAQAVSAYEALPADTNLPPVEEVVELDSKWVEEIMKKNMAEKTKLEVELKTYANNMIKESQRVRNFRSSTNILLSCGA